MIQQSLFKFDPNASDAPLPPGRYDATLTSGEVKTSKAGNEMLEVTLRVLSGDGATIYLRDFLVSTPRMKWKIRRFCQAMNLDFTAGQIDPTLLRDKDVTIEVGVEEDPRGRDRNVINDYLIRFEFDPNNRGVKEPTAAGPHREPGNRRDRDANPPGPPQAKVTPPPRPGNSPAPTPQSQGPQHHDPSEEDIPF